MSFLTYSKLPREADPRSSYDAGSPQQAVDAASGSRLRIVGDNSARAFRGVP
jgi:hypothetical protein